MTAEHTETTIPKPEKRSLLKRIFYGNNGLRVIWGVLLFLVFLAALAAITILVLKYTNTPIPGGSGPVKPGFLLIAEIIEVFIVAIATWLMSLIERRRYMTYNLAANDKLSRFFAGAFCGFAGLSFLVFLLWISGFLVFKGIALNIEDALPYAIEWGAVFLTVALFEETLFRGYLLYNLTRGVGFWWGAVILSVLFAVAHISNNGETLSGLVSVFTIGMMFVQVFGTPNRFGGVLVFMQPGIGHKVTFMEHPIARW